MNSIQASQIMGGNGAKKILDVTCGSRTIWFDKQHPAAVYCDVRDEECSAVWTSTKRDCEIAATNCHDSVRLFRYMWNDMMQGKSIAEGFIQQGNKALNEQRIHPTQKPVALYVWLLQKYAKPGDKILDTHLGSGSSRIAALELGLDFVGYEIDEHYYEAQERRFEERISQGSLFLQEVRA